MRPFWSLFALFALAPASLNAQEAERVLVGGRAGIALFARSQSLAVQHLFKPSASLHVLFPAGDGLWFGGGASGIVHPDIDYQVAGGYALGRYALYTSESFQWGASLGLGIGTNPGILHSDLRAKAPLLPFFTVTTDATWKLTDGMRLGVELSDEQLSVIHLGARVSFAL